MDQWQDLEELSFLVDLTPCNISDPESSLYNFSAATALSLFVEYKDNMLTITSPITIALLSFYIPTFIFALLGNALVIYVIFNNHHMRRVKNLFLVNLAVADILVTVICIPVITGQTIYRLWIYGQLMCKVSGYMQGLAVTCSTFTLVALSIDRYMAIKSPDSLKRMSGKWPVIRTLIIIWILSGIFASPLLFTRNVKTVEFKCVDISFSYCIEEWPNATGRHVYGIMILVVIYVIPISIITVCYGLIGKALCTDQSPPDSPQDNPNIMLGRKRVARMLIVLIVVFVLCWLPYNVCSLSLDLSPSYMESQILPFTLWLGHAHSAINPPLYWFLNKSFRHCMRKVLQCQSVDDERHYTQSPQSYGEFGKRINEDQKSPMEQANNINQLPSLRDQLRMRNAGNWPYHCPVNKQMPRIVIDIPMKPASGTSLAQQKKP